MGQSQARRLRRKHHHRADHKGRDTADPERAEGADMHFGNHQRDAEEDERRAGIIDRHEGERVERKQEADGADEPRRDRARTEKLEDQAVNADQHQDESDIRIGDQHEQLGLPTWRPHLDLKA